MSSSFKQFLQTHSEWQKCPDLAMKPPTAAEISGWYEDASESILQACDEVLRIHGDMTITRGAHYAMMRFNGQSNNMAAMIAMQKGPGLNTDSVFFQGAKPLYDQFGSQKHLNHYLKAAKKHGFTPSKNSTYMPGLARFQGDPEAFVDHTQGRGYIRKLCERRGWSCEGAVNVQGRQPESDPLAYENCKPLAESIIRQRASQMVKSDPTLKRMDRRELRQKIIDKHGPSK